MTYVANDLLSRLVGFRLCSVQFVVDYVQLRFDASATSDLPVLNCDGWPAVSCRQTYREVETGYADALRSFIPEEVVGTTEKTGIGLKIGFPSGWIAHHPTVDDLVGPEIAVLGGRRRRSPDGLAARRGLVRGPGGIVENTADVVEFRFGPRPTSKKV